MVHYHYNRLRCRQFPWCALRNFFSIDALGLHCGPGTTSFQAPAFQTIQLVCIADLVHHHYNHADNLFGLFARLWPRPTGQTHGASLHRFRDRFSDVSIGRLGDLAIDGSTEWLKDSNLLSYLQRLRCRRCIWSALRTWYNTSQTVAFR